MFEQILKSSEYVVNNSIDVKINYDKIETLIEEINNFNFQHYLTKNPFGIMGLNTEDLVNFLLLYDSIDFSFWGNPKWTIEVDGELLDGGVALLWSLLKVFKINKGIKVFKFFSKISREEFGSILKGNVEIPLFNERYNIITSIAKTVDEQMNGSFYSFIKEKTNDIELFDLIIKNFPSFIDVRNYKGKEIPLYKLAQLLTSDILHLIEFKENKTVDYSHLVGCADYKIPQILRSYDILEYSDDLSKIVDSKTEIFENDSHEVEIRTSMLVVINHIYEKLNRSTCRMDINDFIWSKGQDKTKILKPYHLTRTTSY